MTSEVLVAIPLFVFMGMMLERSRIAPDLLEAMGRLFGSLRGGLAVSVTLVGALLAASTGIVGATVVTMGLIALPAMMRRRYEPAFACGTICAAGTLGQIIPPSTVMVILGEVLAAAYQQAQLAQGKFSIETISVGQLFAGSMIPGLMLAGLYILYQVVICWLRPEMGPPIPRTEREGASAGELARALVPPIVLVVAVLGSILGGIATPTEAASVGAVGATLLAGLRIVPGRPLAHLCRRPLGARARRPRRRLRHAHRAAGDRGPRPHRDLGGAGARPRARLGHPRLAPPRPSRAACWGRSPTPP
jgi:tripartite ATP-independent transporter DctM subunit